MTHKQITEKRKIALIAHDRKKDLLAEWVEQHASVLRVHDLIATETTAGVLEKKVGDLIIENTKSRPVGGD